MRDYGRIAAWFAVCVGKMMNPGFSVPAQTLQHSKSGGRPRFEVASIKACASNTVTGTNGGTVGSGRVAFNCQTLLDYVRSGYTAGWSVVGGSVASNHIEGGPVMIRSDLYQITAKDDGSHPKMSDTGEMMRALLEDRSKLKIHGETRIVPVYALVATRADQGRGQNGGGKG